GADAGEVAVAEAQPDIALGGGTDFGDVVPQGCVGAVPDVDARRFSLLEAREETALGDAPDGAVGGQCGASHAAGDHAGNQLVGDGAGGAGGDVRGGRPPGHGPESAVRQGEDQMGGFDALAGLEAVQGA